MNYLKILVHITLFYLYLCAFSDAIADERYAVRNVFLEGITKQQKKDVLQNINLRGSGWFRKNIFMRELIETDVNNIENYFRTIGYLNVSTPTIKLDTIADKNAIDVTFYIKTGKQVNIDTIKFSGNTVYTDDELREILYLQEQKPFDSNGLSNDTWNIVNAYAEEGFINTKVQPESKWDTTGNAITIRFKITEGKQVTVDSIIIQGNKKTKDKIVNRALAFHSGERFNYTKVLQSQNNLYEIGLFTGVRIEPGDVHNQADTLRNVYVRLREPQAGEMAAGVGYGTDTEARVSLRLRQRNLRGTGRAVGTELKFSGIKQEVDIGYTDPWFYSKRNSLDVTAFARRLEDPGFNTRLFGTQIILGRKVSSIGRLNSSYHFRHVELSDINNISIVDSSGKTSSFRFAFVEDRRDNIINTTKGYYLEAAIEVAPPFFRNTINFVRFSIDTRQYRPLHSRVTLAWWGMAGLMWQLEKNKDIPVYERFFAGGEKSIRGFDRNMVGPSDSQTGLPLGGKVLLLQNAELRFPIVKNLSFITFLDIGNTWDRFHNMTWNGFRAGYGPGIRYSFFLGVIGLDYARKWKPHPHESLGRLHFNIGHTF